MNAKPFKKWTRQEKIVAWLKSLGYTEIAHRTNKYVALEKRYGEFSKTYFVGHSGALRRSLTGKVSDSVSITLNREKFKTFCIDREVAP
jgi:hypothetical protein